MDLLVIVEVEESEVERRQCCRAAIVLVDEAELQVVEVVIGVAPRQINFPKVAIEGAGARTHATIGAGAGLPFARSSLVHHQVHHQDHQRSLEEASLRHQEDLHRPLEEA